jgi:hypothetical protein
MNAIRPSNAVTLISTGYYALLALGQACSWLETREGDYSADCLARCKVNASHDLGVTCLSQSWTILVLINLFRVDRELL